VAIEQNAVAVDSIINQTQIAGDVWADGESATAVSSSLGAGDLLSDELRINGVVAATGAGSAGIKVEAVAYNAELNAYVDGVISAEGEVSRGVIYYSRGDAVSASLVADAIMASGISAKGAQFNIAASSGDLAVQTNTILVSGAGAIGLETSVAAQIASQMDDASSVAHAARSVAPVGDGTGTVINNFDDDQPDMVSQLTLSGDVMVIADDATGAVISTAGHSSSSAVVSVAGDVYAIGSRAAGVELHSDGTRHDAKLEIGAGLFADGDQAVGAGLSYENATQLEVAMTVGSDVVVVGDDAHGVSVELESVESASIDVTVGDTLYVAGEGSVGIDIDADSLSNEGIVLVDIGSTVVVDGADSRGLRLSSISGGLGGSTQIKSDDIWYSSNGAALIETQGQTDFALTNYGIFTDSEGVNATPYLGGAGNDQIFNHGMFEGRLSLGQGVNRFVNYAGGAFYGGLSLDLGNEQSVLENWGDFVLGELATPDTAVLTGNLFLGDTGIWYSAIDFNDNTADRIVVSGAARVSGTIHFGLLNANKILPGVRSISLVEALKPTDSPLPLPEQSPSGHLASTAFGSSLGEVDLIFPDSLIMTHNISEDAGLFAFGYDLDFAADWMTTSRQVVGEHFNSIQLNGSSDELAGVIVNLLFTDQEEVINLTYDLITPEIYSRQISQQIQEASYFADRLSRCDRYSVSVAQDDTADCLWMGVGKTDFDLEFGSDWSAMTYDGDEYSLGGQWRTAENVWLGIAASRTHGSGAAMSIGDMSSGKTHQLGVMAKTLAADNVMLGGALTAGVSTQDYQRNLLFGRENVARSGRDSRIFTGRLFIENSISGLGWTLQPGVDLAYSQVNASGVSEVTDSLWGLKLNAEKRQQWWIRPRLDAGFEERLSNGSRVGVEVTVGRRLIVSETQSGGGATLLVAPGGTNPMSTAAFVDDHLWEGGLEFYWIGRSGASISASVTAYDGEYRSAETASVSISIPLR
jgi:hypothetical protein